MWNRFTIWWHRATGKFFIRHKERLGVWYFTLICSMYYLIAIADPELSRYVFFLKGEAIREFSISDMYGGFAVTLAANYIFLNKRK